MSPTDGAARPDACPALQDAARSSDAAADPRRGLPGCKGTLLAQGMLSELLFWLRPSYSLAPRSGERVRERGPSFTAGPSPAEPPARRPLLLSGEAEKHVW